MVQQMNQHQMMMQQTMMMTQQMMAQQSVMQTQMMQQQQMITKMSSSPAQLFNSRHMLLDSNDPMKRSISLTQDTKRIRVVYEGGHKTYRMI